MPDLKDLYTDPHFDKVTDRTKTDIIGAIGININDAEQEIKESKYTQETLKLALRHLVATEVEKKNPNAEALITQGNSTSLGIGNPFYFSNNDPWFIYWMTRDIGVSHQYNGGGGSLSGGGDCSGSKEGAAIMSACAVVCVAGCCCVYCMDKTLQGPERQEVKNAKVTGSALVGAVVFLGLLLYLNINNVWRRSLVEEQNWDLAGYRFFLLLIAAIPGFLSSGMVSTVNNLWLCLPPGVEQPKPSREVLAALKDLEVIQTLLSKGWARPDDDADQCKAFIREVILRYIETIAEPALEVVATETPSERRPLTSAAQMTTFGGRGKPRVLIPTAPPLEQSHSQPSDDYRRLNG